MKLLFDKLLNVSSEIFFSIRFIFNNSEFTLYEKSNKKFLKDLSIYSKKFKLLLDIKTFLI